MPDLTRSVTGLMAAGKGVLAAGENTVALSARLAGAGISPTFGARNAYRDMLVTTTGLSRAISGVLLPGEAFRQRDVSGILMPAALASAGILPGVAADAGLGPLTSGPSGECVTGGLDGLAGRLAGYAGAGARFAAWRATFAVADDRPSWQALQANAHALARFAWLCQHCGMVPVIVTDVRSAGAHALDQCARATTAVLLAILAELRDFGVRLDAVVLAPGMIQPGPACTDRVTPDDVARASMCALYTVLPAETGGVAFRCTGLTPDLAATALAAARRMAAAWPVTFCFGQALTGPALTAWRGEQDRVPAGQRAFRQRLVASTAALRAASALHNLVGVRQLPQAASFKLGWPGEGVTDEACSRQFPLIPPGRGYAARYHRSLASSIFYQH